MMTTTSFVGKEDKAKKILRFGYIALLVTFLNAALDFKRGIIISAWLVSLLALAFTIILILIYKGYVKGTLTAIVTTVNLFIVLLSFAEGLKSGAYLFLLPLLFALAFLISSVDIPIIGIATYFFVTICCFCVCIIYGDDTSRWQYLSEELYKNLFTYNCICVVMLCAAFAVTGIYFEKKYQRALLKAKNQAELHEREIKKQNESLQHIAFMNAHIVRSPLANILALVKLIDEEKISGDENKQMLAMLEASVQLLDNNITEMVHKATYKTVLN